MTLKARTGKQSKAERFKKELDSKSTLKSKILPTTDEESDTMSVQSDEIIKKRLIVGLGKQV
jgi:hypothetical protein